MLLFIFIFIFLLSSEHASLANYTLFANQFHDYMLEMSGKSKLIDEKKTKASG